MPSVHWPVPDLVCDDVSSDEEDDEASGFGRSHQAEDGNISSDDDWHEPESTHALCLFCSTILSSQKDFLNHTSATHNFCLRTVIKQHNLDDYSYIRMINYIRSSKTTAEEVKAGSTELWSDMQWMKPVLADDNVLLFDVEELGEESSPAALVAPDMVQKDIESVGYWKSTAERAQAVIKERDAALARAVEDLQRMKQTVQSLLGGPEESASSSDTTNCIDRPSDEGYFSGYSHFGIHHEMLSDRVRTEGYRDALLKNSDALAGKTVLDVGCGTGILSMFAANAGAAKVVGVDMSDVIYDAMGIVRENGLGERIKLVRSKVEEADLGTPTVDIIISEWMGYFLLFEGMLDSVLAARDKYLTPGGLVLPNRCTMHLVAVADSDRYKNMIEFWNDVYGFKMTSMTKEVIREASIEVIPPGSVASQPVDILDLDIEKCTVEDTNFTASFELVVTRDCEVTAIGGYFDTFFELENKVWFSTGPDAVATHWKQTVFYLPKKISAVSGQSLAGTISCRRNLKDSRWLDVSLSVGGLKDLLYSIS